MNWEEIARAKDAYIEEIRKAMVGAIDSDLVSLATTLKARDDVARKLEDIAAAVVSCDALDTGDVYEIPAHQWELVDARWEEMDEGYKAAMYARLWPRKKSTTSNKALSNEEQQIVIKAMQDALDPPRQTQPQPESPPMNLRAWRCEGDGVTDRNPGYLLWDGLRMWWKTDGRGWMKASRSKTPAEAAKDHGLVEETDAMMIMALSESRCPTCEVGEYMGRYCIDCGRDTRSA